jgi:hypothetical protein
MLFKDEKSVVCLATLFHYSFPTGAAAVLTESFVWMVKEMWALLKVSVLTCKYTTAG